ncbi:MAG: SusC/RagA family TonB-linked outer membrane protein [Sphingobacteriales bacterium]|nr:SusC/RagA family TonB-linked outer membrane protein [Sphingobacteriales bacterium]
MKKKKNFLKSHFCLALLFVGLFSFYQSHGQDQVTIKGLILNSTGIPIEGTSIGVVGKPQFGTTGGADGKFTLTVPANSVLAISCVGYISKNVEISQQKELIITLESVNSSLDEVVVVGYGTVKKTNLTGSVATISGSDLSKRQVGQTSMSLQGVASGVTVTQSTGQPGFDGGSIRIRGIGTLNNSAPLVLVDGVAMSINNVEVSSIESISILKDAASASIYGSRAANGVILITTKRGRTGQFNVSYNMYVGKQKATNLPDMIGGLDHMTMLNEAYTNSGLSPLFPTTYIEDYKTKKNSDPDNFPDVDWQKEVLKGNGLQTNHVLNLSGGNQNVRFFGSFGYLNQNGLLEGINFKRLYARINTSIRISPKFSGDFDMFLVNDKRQSVSDFPGAVGGAITASGAGLIFGMMNKLPAIQAAQYSNGLWAEGQNGVNPLAIIKMEVHGYKPEPL